VFKKRPKGTPLEDGKNRVIAIKPQTAKKAKMLFHIGFYAANNRTIFARILYLFIGF
jgi:hypothetical protein